MSDNIDVTPGVGKTVATDEVTIDGATVQVQRIKPTFGTPGSAVDVSSSNPLPVVQTGALSVGQSGSWSVSVTGTAAVTQSGTWNVGTVTAVTSITNPVAATQSGTWNIGTLATITNPVAVTVADGADVTQGDKSDAAYDGLGGDMSLVSGIRTIANEMLSTDPAAVNMVASTPYYNAAVGTAKYLVTASPAVLTDYYITNPHATDVLSVLIYDASSTASVTVGTTTPKRQIALVGGQSANIGAIALNFAVGVVIAAIKDYTGTTAPTTSAIVSLGYRAP